MANRATFFLLAFPVGLIGIVQLVFSFLSLVVFQDHLEVDFLIPALALAGISTMLMFMTGRLNATRIGFRDALLYATLTWVLTGLSGAIPIISIAHVSLTDGVFESVSALTTTGATILSGLDSMPKSFLLYRQFLQWMGGLGVVIFVVAVLPMLNVGGMRLLKAETPGPVKDDKLSPRIANTAHYLWFVYLLLSVSCAAAYYLAGMDGYDAIAHSLTTVSTGGFSTHDASMGYFQSPLVLLVSDFFMLLGAINFALHFRVLHSRSVSFYWKDEETKSFLIIVAFLSLVIAGVLYAGSLEDSVLSAVSDATFMLISFITSTGFGYANVGEWPIVLIFLLVIAGYFGGCAGSTAGGNKIIRILLSAKVILLEQRRLIHPRGVFIIKYQGKPVDSSILSATASFMSIAAFSSVVITLALMLTGLDFFSALTATAACLNVLGPAFGELGSNFQPVSDAGTWLLSGAMILGRLEYFTVLALFVPDFWRY